VLGLDEWLAGLGDGSLVLALAVAVLLGLRHATDPDHLTAVATLIAGDREHGAGRARRLGLAWGAGHALTLFAFGLPLVLVGTALPGRVTQVAEVAIGLLIAGLAVRLLLRWHDGAFHAHVHTHGGVRHAHPHAHDHPHPREHAAAHEHEHDEALGRSPRAAFGIGLVHGVGGSAGAGILLVGAASQGAAGVAALALFAAGTAVSMALASSGFGIALARGTLAGRLQGIVPALGAASLLFGVWYALGALETVPYLF
jgi:ABC-type nickel/cobalt efflux system permease component RcnA